MFFPFRFIGVRVPTRNCYPRNTRAGNAGSGVPGRKLTIFIRTAENLQRGDSVSVLSRVWAGALSSLLTQLRSLSQEQLGGPNFPRRPHGWAPG